MRKLLLIAILVAAFVSCDKKGANDDTTESVPEPMSSINISDAKTIHERSSDLTKRIGGSTFWKIDAAGNESELKIFADDGTISDAKIISIVKLTDKIVAIQIDAHVTLLGDVQTEKLYRLPEGMTMSGACKDSLNYRVVDNGFIYLGDSGIGGSSQIYQLNPANFALKPMLASGQRQIFKFEVFENDFILYGFNKIQCPGGRIILLDRGDSESGYNDYFVFNNKLFSYEQDMKIYRWNKVDGNTLDKEFVCDFYYTNETGDKVKYRNSTVYHNYVKNKLIVSTSYSPPGQWIAECFEFDGISAITKIENLDHGGSGPMGMETRDALWYQNYIDNVFSILDLQTYNQTTTLFGPSASEYQIFKYFSNRQSPNVIFSGLRYADGSNVIGTITPTGAVTIDKVDVLDNPVVNLIPLN